MSHEPLRIDTVSYEANSLDGEAMKGRACEGGQTYEVDPCGDMRSCAHCDREVRWDMVDHPFWGFEASCSEKRKMIRCLDCGAKTPEGDSCSQCGLGE